MPKTRHTKRRSSRRHKMRGGSSYGSASSYSTFVNGSENAQYDRTFSQSGPYASTPGNTIIGAQGQNANLVGAPNANNLSLIQSAGSKRRHKTMKSRSKKRRGGFLGQVINQAIVPFGILGMQQTYRKRSQKNLSRSSRRYK